MAKMQAVASWVRAMSRKLAGFWLTQGISGEWEQKRLPWKCQHMLENADVASLVPIPLILLLVTVIVPSKVIIHLPAGTWET